MKKVIWAFIMCVLGTVTGESATIPDGHWEGAITLPGAKLQLAVDLKAPGKGGAAWSGSIDIPAQMIHGYGLAEVEIEGTRVKFRMPNIPGDPGFDGKLSKDGNQLDGDFTQNGRTFPFALTRGPAKQSAGETPSHGLPGKGLTGHWQGSLRPGPAPIELRLALNVKEENGTFKATLDSLDQGAKGIPVSAISLTTKGVHLELREIGATYEGTLSNDGSEITGTWKQASVEAPLVFKRLVEAAQLVRPQEPKPPFPYETREVRFPGGSRDVVLAGAITVPTGKGPFPAVALLSGSGAQDRDESLMGHKPFLVLADYLTRHGIAVLRFDDRGYAQSTGDFARATHEDFAADAEAAFKFLRAQSEIDPAHVGLCGHSEGAIHAAIAAAGDHRVAFVVMLAGIGVPMDQLLRRQRQDILRTAGIEQVTSPELRKLGDELFARLRAGKATKKEVHELLAQMAERYTPAQRAAVGLTENAIDQQVTMLTSPWFTRLLGFAPGATLKQVRCPVLALNGEKDLQVSWRENLDGIGKGLADGGNRNVTIRSLPALNHLFQHCQTGAISEYGQIEETLSPEVLQLVSDWIKQQTRQVSRISNRSSRQVRLQGVSIDSVTRRRLTTKSPISTRLIFTRPITR